MSFKTPYNKHLWGRDEDAEAAFVCVEFDGGMLPTPPEKPLGMTFKWLRIYCFAIDGINGMMRCVLYIQFMQLNKPSFLETSHQYLHGSEVFPV